MQDKLHTGAVLEIEDEPENSLLATEVFAELGVERRLADSPSSARNELKVLGPLQGFGGKNLVVVLDLMFPDRFDSEEGVGFLRELRSGGCAIDARTPVIVLSNDSSPETIAKVKTLGAEFFKKTGEPEPLVDRIAFYLGKEFRELQTLCEVFRLRHDDKKVVIRIRKDDVLVERTLDIEVCPPEARIEGGAFYLEAIKRFRDFKTEVVLRGTGVDPEEEGRALKLLLEGLERP